MQILSYQDWDLNFISSAQINIQYAAKEVKEVDNVVHGMKLVIGNYKDHTGDNAYDILLKKGEEAIVAVRLIEKEHLGQKVFEPHSYTAYDHRAHGYAFQIYSWLLDNGFTLLSCGRQTEASRGLWKKLSGKYTMQLFNRGLNKYMNNAAYDDPAVVTVLVAS